MTFCKDMESKTSEELLLEYKQNRDHKIKQEIVLRYVTVVRRIAVKMKDVYSSFAQTEDIVNEGVIALMKAIDKYDTDKNVKFDTYINKRIKGLIIDLARKQDWVPRSIRKSAKEINEAINTFYASNGKLPQDEEIAACLGIDIEQYREKVSKSNFFGILSLEMITEESRENRKSAKLPHTAAENSPENILVKIEIGNVLSSCLGALREREKCVIKMYYHENKNMREIAEILKLSEPRISQIHSNAIKKLRLEMNKFMMQ